MYEYIPKLKEYYLPCKSRLYLTDLDEKKCITILRQLLKQYNYNILAKEKTIKSVKYNFYQIIQFGYRPKKRYWLQKVKLAHQKFLLLVT